MTGRSNRSALAPRAVRVRNVFVCHAATRLGLPLPSAADLDALPAEAGLRNVVERWRAEHGVVDTEDAAGVPARRRRLAHAVVACGVALLALVLTPGSLY